MIQNRVLGQDVHIECPKCSEEVLGSKEDESASCDECGVGILYELDGDEVIIINFVD